MPTMPVRRPAHAPGNAPRHLPLASGSRAVAAPGRRAVVAVHASLLLTAVLWGGNFAASKYLLGHLQPLDLAFLRGAATTLVAAVLLLLSGRWLVPMPRADAFRLVALGLVGITVLNLALVTGQGMLPAALASLIVTSNPIHTALLSRLLGGERLAGRTLGGMALACLGFLVVLLFGSGGAAGLGGGRIEGVLILAVAPLAWACHTVLSKPLLARYGPTHVTAYTSIAGSLAFLALPLLRPGTLRRVGDLSPAGWGVAGFATILAGGLAYLLWSRGLRALPPSRAAVYVYLVPVFGLLSAWLLLGEPVTPYLLLGGAAVLSGVVLTNSSRRPRPAGDGRARIPVAHPDLGAGGMGKAVAAKPPTPLPSVSPRDREAALRRPAA